MNLRYNVVGGDYFAAMGIPFLSGRTIRPEDAAGVLGAVDPAVLNVAGGHHGQAGLEALDAHELGLETAELLRALSGLYDQAARSATSL